MSDIKTKRIAEIVYDITLEIFTDEIEWDSFDTRDLFENIYEWAKEFEASYNDNKEYLDSVICFAHEKLYTYLKEL